jgi:hypothetical protein
VNLQAGEVVTRQPRNVRIYTKPTADDKINALDNLITGIL